MNTNRYKIPKPGFSNRNVSKSNCRDIDNPKMIAVIIKTNLMFLFISGPMLTNSVLMDRNYHRDRPLLLNSFTSDSLNKALQFPVHNVSIGVAVL